jgi:hypothetical protein
MPLVLFHLRGKSSRNDFFTEIFLLKLLFSLVMESLPYPLYKRTKHAIPTFGTYRAHTPTNEMRLSLATSLRTCVLGKSHAAAMFLRHVCLSVTPCSPVPAKSKASPLSASR